MEGCQSAGRRGCIFFHDGLQKTINRPVRMSLFRIFSYCSKMEVKLFTGKDS